MRNKASTPKVQQQKQLKPSALAAAIKQPNMANGRTRPMKNFVSQSEQLGVVRLRLLKCCFISPILHTRK